MADKPVKNVFNSATIFESLAMGLDDPAFEDGADELRGMAANHSSLSARNDNRSIALALKSAWSELYGPDTSLWPENLRSALATIEAGVGLTNFSDNLTSALQGLQLEELTVPAFDAAISIVGEGLRPLSLGSPQRGSPTQWSEEGLIPSSAARAGLHFISRPDRLILPLLAGGIAGRLVGGLATELGSAVGMGASSGTALVQVTGLVAESAGFVATSDVVASFMGPDIGPINPSTPLGTSRATTFYEETFASTIFFGALRIFGAAGRFAQALLPMTETGIAVSKAFGHFTSVMGLAATEEIQARMGGVVAEAFRPPQVDGDLKVAATAPHTFYDKLWRALLLHTTIHTVNGIVNVNGAQSEYASIRAKAREMQNMLVIPAVVSGNLVPSLSVIPEVVIGDIVKLSARDSRIRGNDRLPNVMAMNGKDPPPKRPPQISKIVKPDPIKGLMDILSSTAVVEPEPVASMSSSRTSLTVSDKAVVNALKEALQ